MSDVQIFAAYVRKLIPAKIRQSRHFVSRVVAKVMRKMNRDNEYFRKPVTVYPAFKSVESAQQVLRKIDFARGTAQTTICYICSEGSALDSKAFECVKRFDEMSGIILLHRFSWGAFLRLFTKWHRVMLVDELYYSAVASDNWSRLAYVLNGQKIDEDQNRKVFADFARIHAGKNSATCFVTGPSFDSYKQVSLPSGALKVICNSIVKNADFLNHIGGPDLLVFADPVFHFGPNEYADAFRKCVVDVFKKYQPYIAVPEYCYDLVKSFIPEATDRLIAVNCRKSEDWITPSAEQIAVKATDNILTLFMIPLALSVVKKVYVLGADGRQKNEKYFWHHSKTAQFGELMSAAFEAHPSFFRDRLYEDYYEGHCQRLASQIRYAEENDVEVVSLTKSFIPALAERMRAQV